jgi:hypothetical protein
LSVEARVQLRKQLVALRLEGKTLVEISAITGHARTYWPKLAKEFEPRLELQRS